MGTCGFCGQSAGFLHSEHKECKAHHASSQARVRQAAVDCLQTATDPSGMRSSVLAIARQGFVKMSEIDDLLLDGWVAAVDAFLDDGVLTQVEEDRLIHFATQTGLMPRAQKHPSYSLLVKAAQLRDLSEGKLQSRMTFNSAHGINLQKGESIIWAFPGTEYLEDREQREFVGRSQGVSVRVMRGVYYRVGCFKGRPVTRQERVSLGSGTLFVTTKNLYFAGSQKAIRIPYGKIVSFDQFSDGIGLMRDAASAKPQTFITNDGWFTFNLITLVSQQ